MLDKILQSTPHYYGPILRGSLAAIMLPMGYLKISSFSATMDILASVYHLPSAIAFLVILIEFVVPLLLLVGFGSRIGGLLLAIVMLGALCYHTQHGFFMNWYGNQEGEGYQFHILAIGSSLALFFAGSGKWSIDQMINNKK